MQSPTPLVSERRTEPRTGRTDSFLVRSWREEACGESSRFFVRNLRTGEETYLSGPRALSEFFEPHPEPGA